MNRAGIRLFDNDAVDAVRSSLFPLAAVVTPNSRSDFLSHAPERIETRNNHGSGGTRPSPPGWPGPVASSGGATGERLRDRRHAGQLSRKPGARPAPPLPRALGAGRRLADFPVRHGGQSVGRRTLRHKSGAAWALTGRIETRNNRGSGCTLSSAIAAGLARGLTLPAVAQRAKDYVTAAMRASFPVGRGHGPLHHFHELWGRDGG